MGLIGFDRPGGLRHCSRGPVYYGDGKSTTGTRDRIDTLTRGFLGLTVACAAADPGMTLFRYLTDYYAALRACRQYRIRRSRSPQRNRSRRTTRPRPRSRPRTRKSRHSSRRSLGELKQKVTEKPAQLDRAYCRPKGRPRTKALRASSDQLRKNLRLQYPVIHTLGEAPRPADMPVLIRGNADTPARGQGHAAVAWQVLG